MTESPIVTEQECRPRLAGLPRAQEKPETQAFIWNLLSFKCWQLAQIKTPSGQRKHICGAKVASARPHDLGSKSSKKSDLGSRNLHETRARESTASLSLSFHICLGKLA